MRKQTDSRKQSGFSIIEVVIGIFIFVVGMLALAALQGALTRSMADSKMRTTAVNIADRAIERTRGFTQLLTAATPGVPHAYNDIVTPGSDPTITVNGVTYTIDMDVTDYYYQLSTDTFTTTPTGALNSDYKQVEVTVTWDAAQNFRGDEGTEITTESLGGGSITVTATIPALITSASARVADETTGGKFEPPIVYSPGANPDIVALSLGDSKFKESLTPEPDVIRADELVETRFDVITYSQTGGYEFLRREEFAVVSCECTLRAADADNPGRRPTIWAADEYAGGHLVTKDYGESANNSQSTLCDSCCRDHHDGGTAQTDSGDAYANVFGPFKADGEYTGTARASDHIHYQEDAVTPAGYGDKYLENCRLVRVDGFFRVAQDFRREDQYVFPADFLDNDTTELATYSNYVTGAASAYTDAVSNNYPTNSPPCIGGTNPPCVYSPTMQGDSPAARADGELPTWTSLETTVIDEQQLRSRGVYIDYMSNDLRLFLDSCFEGATLKNDCCIRGGVVASACTSDDLYIDRTPTANRLEIIPFFDVQMTKLENWDQTVQANLPISLTNEALADANLHSRGFIEQVQLGEADVTSVSHRGNIGFTNTLAIDPVFETKQASLNVQSLDSTGSGGGGGGTDPTVVAGTFTESVTGNPKITVSGSGDITCTLAPNGYTCSVSASATSAKLIVTGYEDTRTNNAEARYACSGNLTRLVSHASPGNTSATFQLLGVAAGATYDIEITTTDWCAL